MRIKLGKIIQWGLLLLSGVFFVNQVYCGQLSLELTRGVSGAIPLAIVPFQTQGQPPAYDLAKIITDDLQNSGRFKVYGKTALTDVPSEMGTTQANYFRKLGVDNIVTGTIKESANGHYTISFQLMDAFKEGSAAKALLNNQFSVSEDDLRALAHHISDLIYEQLTGVKGIFSTRLAYVVVQRFERTPPRYILEISDQDGYNPRALLTSTDPIMSPAWSPEGKRIAYVSFENKKAAIYVQNVINGDRILMSDYSGINGAPAWSPDGRKLALVLSKSGSPNIYVMDVASKQLTQLTHDYYINTEPSWAPSGKTLLFTSNRSGNPQIYQLDISSKAVSRLTFEGKYNARASYTRDGNHVVVLNQDSGLFNIGILDLDTGIFHILTHSSSDNESPSAAPNSSMVLFGTFNNGHSVLGMVATDGSVQVRLPARSGDVQDPAWSPFLS